MRSDRSTKISSISRTREIPEPGEGSASLAAAGTTISDFSRTREAGGIFERSASSIREQLLQSEWLRPSDAYGWRAILRNVLPLFALLGLAPALAGVHAFLPWLLSPAIGLFLYRITIVMHDCTHHTLFVSRKMNTRVGGLLGAVSGVDFHSFCLQHWKHHRLYGRAGDPQAFHYADLARMTRGQLRRHLAKPLLGLNLRSVVAESLLAPRNLARSLRTGEIALVILVQVAMLTLVTGLGRYPLLALLPFASGATFALFFSQLRGIAEHGVLDGSDPYIVRSHQPSWLDRALLYDLNFNHHAEHHAHPQIPSCHLPAVQRATGTQPAPRSMFGTLHAMFEERRRHV
ncbi:MAG TPA: fatty acid desaturase [Steroidobacter sp.]|uniref:fatty acid desaturase family protein n=1 Tax=Steroidobacter sp. TaxID=1978227 RepID=UPI002ED89127